MRWENLIRGAAVAATLGLLGACGGGTNGGGGMCGPNQTGVYPNCMDIPQTPAVTLTATGSGTLLLHPSLEADHFFALEAPIRITETAGGTADWNFARISLFLNGAEIERYELGSDVIRAAGYGRIAARSDQVYHVIFRQNVDDFDGVLITLGFSDLKDGRQFTANVDLESFDNVGISLDPIFAPERGTVRGESQ